MRKANYYDHPFTVTQRGPKNWTCTVAGSRSVGWGSRAELAIRDWKRQEYLWSKKNS
jgi:hypothetical protein